MESSDVSVISLNVDANHGTIIMILLQVELFYLWSLIWSCVEFLVGPIPPPLQFVVEVFSVLFPRITVRISLFLAFDSWWFPRLQQQ